MSELRKWPLATLHDLGSMRDFVETVATAAGHPEERVYDMILAVDEATTNVLLHGYRSEPGPVEIEVDAGGTALTVHIRDESPPFDITAVDTPEELAPLAQRSPGGMGIFLIRQSVDDATYEVRPGRPNQLTLTIRTR